MVGRSLTRRGLPIPLCRTLLGARTAQRYLLFLFFFLIFSFSQALSQQRVDPDFRPAPNPEPAYPSGKGPTVWFDEGHHNLVTVQGLFAPMAAVLRNDGYGVSAVGVEFTAASLRDKKILVIGEPVADPAKSGEREKPPSAFSKNEIDVVSQWVENGGRLLLLVDHMPTSGSAAELASAFGISLFNGFVIDWDTWDTTFFSRKAGTLKPHAITGNADGYGLVSKAAAFFGSAFEAERAEPILTVGPGNELFFPDEPWRITETTRKRNAEGLLVGAVLKLGKGRLAVFSDASMFSAQFSKGGAKMGMNDPEAAGNQQLLINTVRWLDR